MEIFIQQDNVSEFANTIKKTSGLDVNMCYQCKKCSSGCPISYAMDYPPAQLMHAIRLGLKDLVFNSNTIWLCASCETCTTRCPQEVDIAKTMDALRIMAFNTGIKPKVTDMAAFYRAGLMNIRFFGRMYELGLIGILKLSTGQLTRDIDLGIKMLKKGKLKLLPSFKGSSSTRRIFAKAKESSRV
jgi:heterodisulfide reductase subunit C